MDIIVCGNALTFKSAFSIEEIDRATLYRPKSVQLLDEDGNALFYTLAGERGVVAPTGVIYETESCDGSGRAVVTVRLDAEPDRPVREVVVEEYGSVIEKVEKVEAQVREALEEIDVMLARVGSKIVVAG